MDFATVHERKVDDGTETATEKESSLRSASRTLGLFIEKGLGTAAALILMALLCLTLGNVVLRYVFRVGFPGTEELAIWLHVALIAVGCPMIVNGGLSMRFDILTRHLPPRGQTFAAIFADLFTMMAALVLCFGGKDVVLTLGGVSPALGVPEWIRFALFIGSGGFILLLLILRRLAEDKALAFAGTAVSALLLYVSVPSIALEGTLDPALVMGLIGMTGLLCAAPLACVFLTAAYGAVAFGSTLPEPAIVASTVTGMSKFLLLAIPFFLLSGGLLELSGSAKALAAFARSLVGHRKAGLAQTTLLGSILFSGASGSSIAGVAFGARTFYPELTAHGYPPARAGALVASCSVLENVIPPSVAFLILAAATNLSVGSLLLGGAVAGLVMALCLAVAIRLTMQEKITRPPAGWLEVKHSAWRALPVFGLGVVVVAGIRLGIVTTTEAAALAACYTFLLCLIGRSSLFRLSTMFRRAAVEAAAIGFLIGVAAPFAFLLAVDDLSGFLAGLVRDYGLGPLGTLIALNLLLLLVGLVLDVGAALLLFGPVLLPIATASGIDPVHFGVIVVVNLMIGGLSPPVGILIYVTSGLTHIPASTLFRAALPYVFALIVSLAFLVAGALLYRSFVVL